MNRDGWKCVICNDDKSPLNVHHTKYDASGDPWETDNEDLFTLCEDCHKIIGWLGTREDVKGLSPREVSALKLPFIDDGCVYFHKVRHYLIATYLTNDGQVSGFMLPMVYVERLRGFLDKVLVDVEEIR